MWLSYRATKRGDGARLYSAGTDGPVLVRLGRGLLPLGLELAVATRMGVNSSGR